MIVIHVVADGSREHVIWWDSEGAHCMVSSCEVNLRWE